MNMATSVIGEKAQITLPKAVREALKIHGKGERVGFILEGRQVILTKVAVVPVSSDYTAAELSALERLSRERPVRTFRSGKAFVKALRNMAGL